MEPPTPDTPKLTSVPLALRNYHLALSLSTRSWVQKGKQLVLDRVHLHCHLDLVRKCFRDYYYSFLLYRKPITRYKFYISQNGIASLLFR